MRDRLISLLLALALLLCLAACGAKEQPAPAAQPAGTDVPAAPEAPKADPAPAPEPPKAGPAPAPEPPKANQAPAAEPPKTEGPPASSSVELSAVCTAMIEGAGISDPLPLDASAFANLYTIDAGSMAQAAGFVTMSGVFPDEVVMIEAVDEAAAAAIAERLQARLDEVMVQAENYDPDSYAAAKKCAVVTDGLFVRLLLTPRQDELAAIYAQYIP